MALSVEQLFDSCLIEQLEPTVSHLRGLEANSASPSVNMIGWLRDNIPPTRLRGVELDNAGRPVFIKTAIAPRREVPPGFGIPEDTRTVLNSAIQWMQSPQRAILYKSLQFEAEVYKRVIFPLTVMAVCYNFVGVYGVSNCSLASAKALLGERYFDCFVAMHLYNHIGLLKGTEAVFATPLTAHTNSVTKPEDCSTVRFRDSGTAGALLAANAFSIHMTTMESMADAQSVWSTAHFFFGIGAHPESIYARLMQSPVPGTDAAETHARNYITHVAKPLITQLSFLTAIMRDLQFTHNDLHGNNCWVQMVPPTKAGVTIAAYVVNETVIVFPTQMRLALFDFDRSFGAFFDNQSSAIFGRQPATEMGSNPFLSANPQICVHDKSCNRFIPNLDFVKLLGSLLLSHRLNDLNATGNLARRIAGEITNLVAPPGKRSTLGKLLESRNLRFQDPLKNEGLMAGIRRRMAGASDAEIMRAYDAESSVDVTYPDSDFAESVKDFGGIVNAFGLDSFPLSEALSRAKRAGAPFSLFGHVCTGLVTNGVFSAAVAEGNLRKILRTGAFALPTEIRALPRGDLPAEMQDSIIARPVNTPKIRLSAS